MRPPPVSEQGDQNVSPQRIEYLWSERLAGRARTPAEEAELVRTLTEQPHWRDMLLDERACDALLRSLGQGDEHDEAFVAEFLRRAELVPAPLVQPHELTAPDAESPDDLAARAP